MPQIKPLIIIPARVGSVRVKHKNFRTLPNGLSLLDLAILDGLKLKGHVVVTTDSTADISASVTVIRRSKALASDTATTRAVVEDVLALIPGPENQVVVLLQPTTPYRDLPKLRDMMRQAQGGLGWAATYRAKAVDDMAEFIQVDVVTGEAYVFARYNNLYPWIWQAHPRDVMPLNIDTPAQWRALCRQVRLEMRANRR